MGVLETDLVRPDPRFSQEYTMIESLEGERVIPINEPFSIDGKLEELAANPGKLWLSPDFLSSVQPAANYTVENDFDEVWEWGETRRQSRNHVLFGRMTLGFVGDPITLPVACKPYQLWHEGALHEYTASDHINDLGFIKTYEPLGIWVNDQSAAFLLTHFEPNVITIDNLKWDIKNEYDSEEVVHDALMGLQKAAYTLARFHAYGFTHRDSQAKNIGYDRELGAIRAIDLEQLRLVQTEDEPDLEGMYDAMLHDVLCFIGSIHAVGFRWADHKDRSTEVLTRTLLDIYRSPLRHPSTMMRKSYGAEAPGMVEQLCDFISDVTEAQIEEYWQQATCSFGSDIED